MIIARDWIWLHLPKCAGTTTEGILRHAFGNDPDILFDRTGPGRPYSVHHSIAARSRRVEIAADGRRVFSNIRRLPHWLLSRVHFQLEKFGGQAMATRAQLCRGRFLQHQPDRSPRLVSADSMITPFRAEVTDWIRTEDLLTDIERCFGLGPEAVPADLLRRNTRTVNYVTDLSFWFRPGELQKLYDANPVWRDTERQVYGDLVRL